MYERTAASKHTRYSRTGTDKPLKVSVMPSIKSFHSVYVQQTTTMVVVTLTRNRVCLVWVRCTSIPYEIGLR